MNRVNVLTASTTQLRPLLRSRKPSNRKLRLFMVACCRYQPAIKQPDCLALVDLAECVADGEATNRKLAAARKKVFQWCEKQSAVTGGPGSDRRWIAQWGAYQAATNKPTSPSFGFIKPPVYRPLLADILGPREAVFIRDEWRTETVVALARKMYDSRDFSAMPILADAFQEAECEDDVILTHCRDPKQVHVRGCWIVDLLLGKE